LLGTIQNREHTLNLQELAVENRADFLEDLGAIFTAEEVWNIIKEPPADRAPGPDGFIGAFYKRSWPVIKPTIMAAVLKLFVGDERNFGRLNWALITLIPKKPDVQEIGDYRPISLVHSFAKLFTMNKHETSFLQGYLIRRINQEWVKIMVFSEEASIGFQQLSNNPSSRLKHSIHVDMH
jgi:hypothetical protein